MIIKCQTTGCESSFETDDTIAMTAKFVCRNHTPKEDQKVFFQEALYHDKGVRRVQFDKTMRRSGKPQGTAHIPFQGSDGIDSDHIYELVKAMNPGEDDGN